jgi:hypothetical protein
MQTTKATVPTTSVSHYGVTLDTQNLGPLNAAILNALQAHDATIVSVSTNVVMEGKAVEISVTAPQAVSATNIKAWL